jgi:hypothetical protein
MAITYKTVQKRVEAGDLSKDDAARLCEALGLTPPAESPSEPKPRRDVLGPTNVPSDMAAIRRLQQRYQVRATLKNHAGAAQVASALSMALELMAQLPEEI